MLRRILSFIAVLAVPLSLIAVSALPARADESPPTLSPAQGPPGTAVTASATDWSGCSSMSVSGWGTTLGTTSIDSTGAFSLSFTVPSNAPVGATQLQFSPTCSHSTILTFVTFTVTQGTPPPASCSPSVSINPGSGPVGAQFVMAGKGWLAGGTVDITLPANTQGLFESKTPFTPKVGTDGTWQITVIVGKSPAGSYTFTFAETGCASQTATFTVTASSPPPVTCNPSVSLTPSSGRVGTKFTLAGTGWTAGGSVKITLPYGSKGIFLASTWNPAVAANGTWQFTATVGKSPAGSYTFTFAESGCASKIATFTVTAPPPPAACSQVWFIGARGSGETASGFDGMGLGVDYMAKVLAAQLKADGGQSVHLMPVDYPADSVNDLLPDNAVLLLIAAGEIPQALALYKETSVAEYDTSIESGMTVTLLDVANVLKRCSGARIILAGYSQGAIAVHDAENWIAAHVPSELRHIVGTLLLADGDRVANTKAREFGTSLSSTAKGLRVSLGLVKPQDVPLPQSTASIANNNDIVADFAFSHFATGISVHTHYAYPATVNGKSQMLYDPALGEAAHWVASRVLAGV